MRVDAWSIVFGASLVALVAGGLSAWNGTAALNGCVELRTQMTEAASGNPEALSAYCEGLVQARVLAFVAAGGGLVGLFITAARWLLDAAGRPSATLAN